MNLYPKNSQKRKYLSNILKNFKYPNGIICPQCKSKQIYKVKRYPKKRQCGSCRKNFSIFKGSIFENSKIPFKKWLFVMHFIVNARKSVSACQICREIGGSYKTSWRLIHKIRESMLERNVSIKLFKLIEEINKNYRRNTKYTKEKIGAKKNKRISITEIYSSMKNYQVSEESENVIEKEVQLV